MNEKLKTKFSNLKLLALDVDGVLTDGKLFYSENEQEFKVFDVKDGLGLKRLIDAGINIAIITSRNSKAVEKRAAELGIRQIRQGVKNKLKALIQVCRELKIEINECAYMGDDLPDLEAMANAGISLTVADAAAEIVDLADWVSSRPGGQGAVREICEIILRSLENKKRMHNHWKT